MSCGSINPWSVSAGKLAGSSTVDPSGVAQGIPTAVDDDSIASLDEEEPIAPRLTTFHPAAPMDHDEEMFKGKSSTSVLGVCICAAV